MNVAKVIQIDLKDQMLTLEVSDELLQRVKEAYNLNSLESISERHLKYYIVSSMKNALVSKGQL